MVVCLFTRRTCLPQSDHQRKHPSNRGVSNYCVHPSPPSACRPNNVQQRRQPCKMYVMYNATPPLATVSPAITRAKKKKKTRCESVRRTHPGRLYHAIKTELSRTMYVTPKVVVAKTTDAMQNKKSKKETNRPLFNHTIHSYPRHDIPYPSPLSYIPDPSRIYPTPLL